MSKDTVPCPFCGDTPEFENTDERARLRCTGCGTEGGVFFFSQEECESGDGAATEARAIEAWNRRASLMDAPAVPVQAEREMLRRKIMDAMKPLSKDHDFWRGWPGTWHFAEAALVAIEKAALEPVGAHCFVQPVPDHCDRITWRNHYYHLPLAATPAAVQPAPAQVVTIGHTAPPGFGPATDFFRSAAVQQGREARLAHAFSMLHSLFTDPMQGVNPQPEHIAAMEGNSLPWMVEAQTLASAALAPTPQAPPDEGEQE